MRIMVDGSFDPRTAEGRDAVQVVLALEDAGQDVVLRPVTVASGLPARFAALLTKDPTVDPEVALSLGPVRLAGFGDGARLRVVWSSHPGQSVCDLVLATDPDSVQKLRDGGRRARVEYVPYGIDAKVWPQIDREGGVNVGVVSGMERTVRAWAAADRGQSALWPLHSSMTVPERIDFYASVDVLVSLHPSRASTRACAEFMATGGVPALAPGGEHAALLNPASCFELGVDGWGLEALFHQLPSLRPTLTGMGRIGMRSTVAELHWPHVIEKLLAKIGRVV